MTTRDSHRDPTQSLSLEADAFDDDPNEHPSLAVGTGDEPTRVESPSGRQRPIVERAPTRPPPRPRASTDAPEDRIGNVLGSYRLGELLGKGGMGYVYRAEHIKLGREVALKLLRADYARRRDAVLRFFQEAKTVNRVRHRNIVDVTDFIELDDGTTFIIMELLQGQSLGRWARTGIDLPRALAVLVQICDGLGAAHAVGVIHRDLKPDNVIVVPTSDGAELVKLLDFGVAKLVNRDDEDVGFQTAAGSVIGTPAYMSPEQAGGMALDQRSDIYSIGAIMYELFCGQPMFKGRSFGEYVRKHLTEHPVPPRQTQGGQHVDARLEALIMRCLAKDPDQRFGHILELRDGLLNMLGAQVETRPPNYALSGQHPMLPSSLHASALHPSTGYQSMYVSQATPAPPPPTPVWIWLAGGAIAVALGVTGAVLYASRGESAHVAAPVAETQTPMPAPVPTPVPTPTPTPIPTPTPAPPTMISLRFDSLPSGGVYADGHSAELCNTPCSFEVDLKDGGPTDRRTYVVRSAGYLDKPVEVDLTADKHAFAVTLDRVVAEDDHPKSHPSVSHPVAKAHDKKPGADKTDKVGAKPVDKPADNKTDSKPSDKIDPADTLDPFHRHPQ